ncbi:hypothetical protein SLS55_000933 [Diplodia seriata]|uniref:NACHT-NTPase and P-loop NTPases N-terminal domain-containing protein n=1 Tax=Diplodia seriata TaxID=420778 RepID=A0ABR3CVR6_9PEZI
MSLSRTISGISIMADPVSVLGTVPALFTLPAVLLQAVQTIQNFSKSVKNAPDDVRKLLNEVEAMQVFIQDIRAQCDDASTTNDHDTLQDFLKMTGLLQERLKGPLKELQELQAGLEKPSRTHRKIMARIRKYLSEGEVKDHLDHLSGQMITLQLLYLRENE